MRGAAKPKPGHCERRNKSRPVRFYLRFVGAALLYTAMCADVQSQEPLPAPMPPDPPEVLTEGGFVAKPRLQFPIEKQTTQPMTEAASGTFVLQSIATHLEQVDEQESRSLRDMEHNIARLRQVLDKHKQQTEENSLRFDEAQRREQQAIQVAEQAKLLAESAQQREQQVLTLIEEIKKRNAALSEQAAGQQAPNPATAEAGTIAHPSEVETPSEDVAATPRTVTGAAVDRRALADNLFAAGEYKLATEIYREMLGSNSSADEAVWYRYQVATGYRHLGNLERSATYYREVAAEDKHEFLAENAKWWLAALDRKSDTEQRLTELTMVMQQVRNAVQTTE